MDPEPRTRRRIFLLGSEGFIGGHIYGRIHHRRSVIAPLQAELDILDRTSLKKNISADDIVVNAAGYANATDHSREGQLRFKQVNVEGVRNVAEACANAKARQLIHISSVAAMGRLSGDMVDENISRIPNTRYGKSKAEAEQILKAFKGRVPITILRPTSVFGEGRGLAKTLCELVRRRYVPLPLGGSAQIPFTYVQNVAKGVELCLDNPNCFDRTFIVGDEKSYLLKDLILHLAQGMNIRPRIVSVPVRLAYLVASTIEITARLLGKKPMIDRNRLDTLCTSINYSIRAFQEATGYVPDIPMPLAAKRIGEWYIKRSV